jgi:hypothetical protein
LPETGVDLLWISTIGLFFLMTLVGVAGLEWLRRLR